MWHSMSTLPPFRDGDLELIVRMVSAVFRIIIGLQRVYCSLRERRAVVGYPGATILGGLLSVGVCLVVGEGRYPDTGVTISTF